MCSTVLFSVTLAPTAAQFLPSGLSARINEHDRSTLWIAFHCLLPFTNCADEGGLSARECLSENRIRDGPSLIRVGAISLHVATHPIGMLGLVAVT